MTAQGIALAVLVLSLCGASVTALILVARWIERRANAEQVAAETFPAAEDVAAAQVAADDDVVDAWVDEMVATLDEAIGDVDALFEAAALVDELEGLQALLEDMGAHVNRVDRQAAA